MFIELDLRQANSYLGATKEGIQRNIDALERAIQGKPLAMDFIFLIDAKSILEAIQKHLPEGEPNAKHQEN